MPYLGANKGMPCQQISSNLYYGMCEAKGEPVPYSGTLPSQVRPLRGCIQARKMLKFDLETLIRCQEGSNSYKQPKELIWGF
jgi:hypothetical protein